MDNPEQKSLRIAIATTELAMHGRCQGGLGHHSLRLALALRDAGHHPILVAPGDDQITDLSGIPVHLVSAKSGFFLRMVAKTTGSLFSTPLATAGLARRLGHAVANLGQIDVVHCSHLAGIALGMPANLPMVIRLSSWYPLWRDAGDGERHDFAARSVHRRERAAIIRANAVYGPCATIAQRVAADLGRKVVVIENPFQLEVAAAPATTLPEAFILTVGTLNRLKGLDALLEIVPRLLANHPTLMWHLVGKDVGGDALTHLRAKCGVHASRVKHDSLLDHPSLYRRMIDAKAVVLPSLVDNLPNTCLEAMANGAIVVGTPDTGMEQFLNGTNGFLASSHAPEHILSALQCALDLSRPTELELRQQAQTTVARLAPARAIPTLMVTLRDAIADHRRRQEQSCAG